jgi:hypothetical protein
VDSWPNTLANMYALATPDIRAAGAAWYPDAHRWAARLARAYGSTVARVAGAAAALSPRISWPMAQRDTESALRDGRCYLALGSRRRLALEILIGSVRPLDALSGPKVRSFYRNIMGDPDAVTIDVHMLRAVGLESITPRRYSDFADAVRVAAMLNGVPPRDLQATVWIVQRGRP